MAMNSFVAIQIMTMRMSTKTPMKSAASLHVHVPTMVLAPLS